MMPENSEDTPLTRTSGQIRSLWLAGQKEKPDSIQLYQCLLRLLRQSQFRSRNRSQYHRLRSRYLYQLRRLHRNL